MDRFIWGGNSGSNAAADVGVSFDALGRVAWVGRNHVGGTAYGYDLADRVTQVQIEAGTGELWTWSYNAGGQVKTKTGNNTAYDQTPANDNEAHTYDGLNRDAAVTAVSGYDANQNLTTDPVGARSFTYDAENKLVAASGSGTSAAISLSYDPLGRLYQEVATSGGSSTTTQFLYSGDKLVAEYNGAGVMQMRYLHGPSEDQPLIQYGGSSVDGTTAQFLYTDRQGSVVAFENTAGTVQTPFTYGPYGEPASWGGTRFAYTGQIEIPEARLYHYKARAYDPVKGGFLQTDPIGYKDDLNLYAYTGDDPLNFEDPTGLEEDIIVHGNRNKDLWSGWGSGRQDVCDQVCAHKQAVLAASARKSDKANRWLAEGALAPFLFLVPELFPELGEVSEGADTVEEAEEIEAEEGGEGVDCCFVAGTPVSTKNGLKSIEKIKIGDWVLSKNVENKQLAYKQVTALVPGHERIIYNLSLKIISGSRDAKSEILQTTNDHRWRTVDEKWTPTAKLHAGDRVQTASGEKAEVETVFNTGKTQPTYNLVVADFHTYFVGQNKIWVHNTCPHGNKGGKGRCNQCKRERQEHKKGKRGSTKDKHQKGQSRKQKEMDKDKDK